MRIGKWFLHSKTEKGLWRGFASRGSERPWAERISTSLEVAWLRKVTPGFSIKFGNRGSETPIDWHISLYWIAVFGSLEFPGLGAFCAWLGRGHKRELSLRFHDGSMWWNIWYNDDHGYDTYHKCDKWRRPKLWPWSMGREKYRSWMCLREGNIALNPIEALWGWRVYNYDTLEEKTKLFKMKQFPGDEYEIKLKLQSMTSGREYGPKWARKRKHMGWRVDWDAYDCGGIPYRNNSWKGDEVLASSVKIDSPNNWVAKAVVALHKQVEEWRSKYNFQPPAKLEGVDFAGGTEVKLGKTLPPLIDIPQKHSIKDDGILIQTDIENANTDDDLEKEIEELFQALDPLDQKDVDTFFGNDNKENKDG